MMSKKRITLQKLIQHLSQELEVIALSAKVAHEAAINEESKAEDQYDTRGLESSYLASAQALRGEELKKQIQFLSITTEESHKLLSLKDEDEDLTVHFLLTKFAGGTKIDDVTVITPDSPVGAQLMDKSANDEVEIFYKGKRRTFIILSIV